MKKLVILHVKGTSNNLILVVTDPRGCVIYRDSGGINTKLGRDKNSLKVASVMASKLSELFNEMGISAVIIKSRNRGAGYPTNLTNGSKLVIANIQKHYNVLNIHRVSPFVHGTIRIKKPKRR